MLGCLLVCLGSGGRTRTCDLRVMSPTSWLIPHQKRGEFLHREACFAYQASQRPTPDFPMVRHGEGHRSSLSCQNNVAAHLSSHPPTSPLKGRCHFPPRAGGKFCHYTVTPEGRSTWAVSTVKGRPSSSLPLNISPISSLISSGVSIGTGVPSSRRTSKTSKTASKMFSKASSRLSP